MSATVIRVSDSSLSMVKATVTTVFVRTLAMATINFNLAGVRLLIEGSSYSRAAFINNYFGATSLAR